MFSDYANEVMDLITSMWRGRGAFTFAMVVLLILVARDPLHDSVHNVRHSGFIC